MSHLTTIKTEVRDPAAIRAACARLKLAAPEQGKVKFYDEHEVTGWTVKLPGWRYPIVIQADGKIAADNYQGGWGKQEHLDRFVQIAAVERAKIEARKKGYVPIETKMPNGSIRLMMQTR